jgi:dolichol-phosphate mannosyltransferase
LQTPALALSVVIPVFNESESLPLLCDRLASSIPAGTSHEILFIDDSGYNEETFKTLDSLKPRPNVRVIHLSRNFGQHVAIAAGLKNARGDHILVLDADLQYDPSECVRFLEVARRENRALVLSIVERRRQPFFKSIATNLVYRTMTFLGTPVTRNDLGSVFLVNRHLALGLSRMLDRYRFTITMALWLTRDVAFQRVSHSPRAHGRSGYNLRKLVFHAITGLTSFSSRPLYVALVFSFIFMAGAAVGAAYLVAQTILNGKFYLPGWASTITVILACTAAILGCLGILGIYVGRIFDATQGRPLYFYREDARDRVRLFEET